MRISIENSDKPITEFKIRHNGENLNFAWVQDRPLPINFPTKIEETNRCIIYISDILELENIIGMLQQVAKGMEKAIGHFE